jgi:hypothetical protein
VVLPLRSDREGDDEKMGITHQQVRDGVISRLRHYVEQLEALRARLDVVNSWAIRNELDANALAFAHLVTTSDHVHMNLGHVQHAFTNAQFIDDDDPAVVILELIIRGATTLVSIVQRVDTCQHSEVDGASAALHMVTEGFTLAEAQFHDVTLYISDDRWRELAGDCFGPYSWLGLRNRLDRDVPTLQVTAAIERLRREREEESE